MACTSHTPPPPATSPTMRHATVLDVFEAGDTPEKPAWSHKLSPQAFRLLKQLARRGNAEAGPPAPPRTKRDIMRSQSRTPRLSPCPPWREESASACIHMRRHQGSPPTFPPTPVRASHSTAWRLELLAQS